MLGHPDWTHLYCEKCGSRIMVPTALVEVKLSHGTNVAFGKGDADYWTRRNGGAGELKCPFHGGMTYFLYPVGP